MENSLYNTRQYLRQFTKLFSKQHYSIGPDYIALREGARPDKPSLNNDKNIVYT